MADVFWARGGSVPDAKLDRADVATVLHERGVRRRWRSSGYDSCSREAGLPGQLSDS